jgi:hypothetical protein
LPYDSTPCATSVTRIIEVAEDLLRVVGDTVAIGVFETIEPFFMEGEIAPVARAIAVPILQPWILGAVFRARTRW